MTPVAESPTMMAGRRMLAGARIAALVRDRGDRCAVIARNRSCRAQEGDHGVAACRQAGDHFGADETARAGNEDMLRYVIPAKAGIQCLFGTVNDTGSPL